MADERRGSRAWAVLAVALALMALVTSLSSEAGQRSPAALRRPVEGTAPATRSKGGPQPSGRSAHTGPRTRALRAVGAHDPRPPRSARAAHALVAGARAPADSARAHRATGDVAPQSTAAGSGARSPGILLESAGSRSPAAEPDLLPAGSAPPPNAAGSGSTGSPTSTAGSDSTGSPTSTAGSDSTGSPTSTATRAYPGHASIDPPSTSASFAALGGSAVSARAVWTGTSSLELEISCAGGVSATRTGSSGLSLEVDDARGSGNCTVTVSLPPGVQADVSFTLIVDPAP
ncbi:MAG: hypothetical protein ACYCSX_12270 [Acidimicrobiales bacterium]